MITLITIEARNQYAFDKYARIAVHALIDFQIAMADFLAIVEGR